MTFLETLNREHYGDVIQFAKELGERFSDLSDYQILLACSEYIGHEVKADSPLGRGLIEVYDRGA